jgi:hypothetical protein
VGVFSIALAHAGAMEIFAGSVLFPFVLSAAGLIALGILYAKNRPRLERAAQRLLPENARRFLPNTR